MSEYAAGKLCAFHPTTFTRNGTKLGNLSTVDCDRDDFTGVDAVEQRSSAVSEFTRGDGGHVA